MSAWGRNQPIPDGAYTVQFTWNSTALQSLLSALKEGYPSGYASMVDHVGRAINGRPLVAIDPEDREQVENLIASYSSQPRWHTGYTRDRVDAMQAALREFANPNPPKPDEPTGLGAVARDADGQRWVRALSSLWSVAPWKREDCGQWGDWNGINAVEVLSEGVTP